MRYLHRQAKKRKDLRLADRVARPEPIVILDNYYYTEAADSEPATNHRTLCS